MNFLHSLALILAFVLRCQAGGYNVDFSKNDSIKAAMSDMAYDMMTFYHGNESGGTPGLLPGPCATDACYYWWEAGAMFGALINYWEYTGDTTYNPTVSQAMLFQIGDDKNYNPANQSTDMGLDDQQFWAFSAMDAVESNFPAPPPDQPQWLALAQNVFDFQVGLWDPKTCGGGFHWQVFAYEGGYNLKNAISNGGFFQLAARLARYTGNTTFSDWAVKTWDWMESTPLFQNSSNAYQIWDNVDSSQNCVISQHNYWTYNPATLVMGSAYMFNYTNGSSLWQDRLTKLLNGLDPYFPSQYGGDILVEACDAPANCNNDQSSFKAYMARWLGVTIQIAPFTTAQITPWLQKSAQGAVGQCDGGNNGRMCGRRWYTNVWDGSSGVGQQMSALSVLGVNLITNHLTNVQAPLTPETGGNSTNSTGAPTNNVKKLAPITTKDRAGAGILTTLILAGLIGMMVFLFSRD